MAEHHPAEDVLLDLALGDVAEGDKARLEQHLSSCVTCRGRYDAVASTIDHTLAAAPRIQPPPGFDVAVLTAMGLSSPSPPAPPARAGRWRRRPVLVAVAAGLIGLAVGIGGTIAVGTLADAPPPATATPGAPLVTASGDTVGLASFSYLGEQRVLVIAAAGGREGVRYECRVRLADGSTLTVGQWAVPENGATWVVPAPEPPAVGVELVAESGRIWSTAEF